jgi:hypothetical protein
MLCLNIPSNENLDRNLGFDKCPEPIDLTLHLERILFSKDQIEWIYNLIKEVADGWFEIESIAEFPLNHDYGFKRDGGCKKNSKYNLLISFIYRDETNRWTGQQRARILLIKNKI